MTSLIKSQLQLMKQEAVQQRPPHAYSKTDLSRHLKPASDVLRSSVLLTTLPPHCLPVFSSIQACRFLSGI
eukprot:scaffold392700_cov27-Prasinocladus_malaysianus.AAC.2